MTKKEIARQIAERHGIDQVAAKRAVQDVLDSIVASLLKSGRIELRNFGVFEVKRRAPRVARNPRTNEQVRVPARNVVVFQPGRALAQRVSQLVRPPGTQGKSDNPPGGPGQTAAAKAGPG